MNKLSRVAALLIILAIAGCATPVANYTPQSKPFSRPPLNQTNTVSVGDEMLAQGNLVTRDGIMLPAEVKISGYTLSAGFYPKTGGDAKFNYHSMFYLVSPVEGYGSVTKNFIVDPPSSLQASVDGKRLCVITVFSVAVCKDGVAFEAATKSVSSDSAFQQTLIYSGRVGTKINISYREFYGTTARPAFNNDVEYDLSTSDVVAYRGAQLKIINADNKSITYQVLSNFNTPPRQ